MVKWAVRGALMLALMAGYLIWGILAFPVMFAVLYAPPYVSIPVIFVFWAAYGAIAWASLGPARPYRGAVLAVIPLPALAYMVYSEVTQRHDWHTVPSLVIEVLFYGAGAVGAALLARRRAAP
ncbi:hypothetical protein [Solirhodobacter olei]|uniref:hypothetical protein n=1 Tax=Solirhodobacter olei TaxID=2493082 RepID=UPI0013E3863C|nr:hypothetical protein [Solirhodobacter olei]